ncbi:MAG: dockerin type I repeat-containing protein [Phycisphaerales bacterium]
MFGTRKNSNRMFALLLAAGLSAPALAQPCTAGGTLMAGPIANRTVFRQGAAPASSLGGGVANSDLLVNGTAGTDHLNKNWCWYRPAGGVREYALDQPHCTGPAAAWFGTIGNEYFDYGTFQIKATYQVVDTGVNSGYMVETFEFITTSLVPICIDFLCYADFKVNGDNADDSGLLSGGAINDVRFSDAGSGTTAQFYAPPPPVSSVPVASTALGSAASVLGLLSDGAVSTPFAYTAAWGPGDAAACFHWYLCFDSQNSAKVVAVKAINTVLPGGGGGGLFTGGPVLSTADANGDGTVDVRDAVAFQNAIAAGLPDADLDGNGKADANDLIRWMSEFTAAAK